MGYQIPCEQFVYGKLVGVRGASYDLIAKSSGITPDNAFDIYKGFNCCRPSATAIASMQTAYVIRRFQNEQIVLLRLARSKERELGRSFFLQERYVVLSQDGVINSKIKLWLWLLGMPSTPPSFTDNTELPSCLFLNKREIHNQIIQAVEFLSSNNDFRRSVITTLYYILHSLPTAVYLHNGISDNWIWLTALSLLMPNIKVAETELYIGRNLPQRCRVDIGIVEENVNDRNIHYLDFSSQSESLPSLDQAKKSYINLSRRCLEANDLHLLNELINAVEGADIQEFPSAPTAPLDVLLWISTMPTVGLQLARKELQKDRLSIDDLHWLWRESINNFTADDIMIFFPILVKRTINNWGDADFASLSDLIRRMPNAINEIDLDNEVVPSFLDKWTDFSTTFTRNESNWFVSLLEQFMEIDPNLSITLLIKWINKAEIDNLFNDVLGLVRLIPQDSMLNSNYWDLVLPLGNKVKNQTDLTSFHEVLQIISVDEEKQPLLRFINMIYGDGIVNYERHQFISVLSSVFRSADEKENCYGDVAATLLFLSLCCRKEEALIPLAIVASHNEKIQYTQSFYNAKESIHSALNEWIIISSNNELIGSFLFLVGRLGYPGLSNSVLSSLLHEKSGRFFHVVMFIQDQLHVQRNDLKVSFEDLSSLSETEQLNLLTEYILFTEKLPFTSTELNKLENLLVRVPSLDSISSHYQNWLLNIFWRLQNWRICQRILEHQIRTALLKGDVEQGVKTLEILESCVNSMETGFTSSIWSNSIIRYFRVLSEQQKEKFFDWLLKAPLREPPIIEHMFLFFPTSAVLGNNTDRFSNDPVVRLNLFNEAVRVKGRN